MSTMPPTVSNTPPAPGLLHRALGIGVLLITGASITAMMLVVAIAFFWSAGPAAFEGR
jgi:hypothetical protein